MRSEKEMMDLVLSLAEQDERVLLQSFKSTIK
ncbi:aminoglycoside 6-adenylyltransferase [Streptococcus agalactiae]|nr:aminoglycoside 6-adenylyltransferase [Streptococcus agalactiae]MCC4756913.1 aminoglycoside 6-adenylyltransferase [Streptococcus agalactiae]